MPPCATGPVPSRGVGVIAIAAIITLVLLRALLELLICLLELCHLCQKLRECAGSLFVGGSATMLALPKTFLKLAIFLVLTTVCHIRSRMQAPMPFAQGTMLRILARCLGDGFLN